MIARRYGHFVLGMAVRLGVLALAIQIYGAPAPARAATFVETMRASGDEYVAVVSGGYTGQVLFVDVKSLSTYKILELGGHTEEAVVGPGDGCIYVTDREQSLIRVIDPSTAEVLGKVSLPTVTGLPHVAVSKDGEVLYVVDELSGRVFRIQTRRGVYQAGSLAVPGSRLQSIALTNDGQRLLIVDYGQARIVVVSTNPFGPLADIPLDSGFPLRITVSANDSFALVTDELLGRVSVLDLAHSVISAKLPVRPGAFDTVIAPDGKSAYVSVWPTRAMFRIDLVSWRSTQMTSLPFSPGPLDVSPDGRYLVVAERLGALEHLIPRRRPVGIALVDTSTGGIVHTSEFIGDPHAVRFLKTHPTDGQQQPACPGFRSGEWAWNTTDGALHG